jgi:hypothetical protein
MRFSFTVLFFSLMMFEGTSFAQNETDSLGNQKKIISHVGKQWYIGSTPVKQVIIDNALKTNPYSANDYSTAKSFYYPALTLTSIAGVGIVYGIDPWIEEGKEVGPYLMVGGVIIGAIGIFLAFFADDYYDSSIELYNKSIRNHSYKSNNTSQENEIKSEGNQKKVISRVDNQWYIGSTPVKQVIIDNALKTNPYSANDYSTAKSFYYPAMFLAFTGVAGIGYGLITPLGAVFGNSSSLEAGKYLVVGGLIIGGIGLVLGKVSNSYLDSSIELYNKNNGNESAFKVKLVPTEKGGLALAFAF